MDEEVAVAPEQTRPVTETASSRTQYARLLLIAILVAAILAQSVLLFRSGSDEGVRGDVLQVSRRFAALLTTYSAATIERQRSQVLALATGKFRGEYDQLTGPDFVTTLKERQADSQGIVVRIAVTEIEGDAATVLALVRVTTKNKDTPAARVDENLLELSLVETSSGWKIDGVTTFGRLVA